MATTTTRNVNEYMHMLVLALCLVLRLFRTR